MKKIVFVISKLNLGGAQTLIYNYTNYFEEDYEIFIIYFEGGALEDKLKRLSCTLIRIPVFHKNNLLGVFKLLVVLHKLSPEIVHSHLVVGNLLAPIFAFFARVPKRIVSVHCVEPCIKNIVYKWGFQFGALFVTQVVAVSGAVKESLVACKTYPAHKITVINNGIDAEWFNPKRFDKLALRRKYEFSEQTTILGTIGRITEQKGHIYLISAFEKLVQTNDNLVLLIVGTGAKEKELKEEIVKKGIVSKVFFISSSLVPEELLSIMDVFVFPSLWEGLPLALLEAMGMGLPVVTTNVCGITDVVEDNKSGVVVKQRDADDLVAKLSHVLSDKKLQQTLAVYGRARVVSRFGEAKMFNELRKLYES